MITHMVEGIEGVGENLNNQITGMLIEDINHGRYFEDQLFCDDNGVNSPFL